MEVREIRRRNVEYLADKRYTRRSLSDRLGYPDNNYVNQLVRGHAKVGPGTARKVEAACALPDGWLDAPHPDLWGETPEEVAALTEQLLGSLSNSDLSRLIDRALKIIQSRKD